MVSLFYSELSKLSAIPRLSFCSSVILPECLQGVYMYPGFSVPTVLRMATFALARSGVIPMWNVCSLL